MQDLKQSGLDITYDPLTKTLLLEGKKITPTIRKLKDIIDTIYDKRWLGNTNQEKELYYMFRDIAKKEHRETIEKNNLRYDITIIPPGTLGQEYTKTAGHNHPIVPDTNITYTELYEVIKGEGLYLLQKTKKNKITDAYFIKAKAGDKIIIPPGYAHITINAGEETLIMANWVARNFTSEYDHIKTLNGGAYYVTTEKTIKNENYDNRSNTIKFKTSDKRELLRLKKGEPIYNMIKEPFSLKFLTEPQNHHRLFDYVQEKPSTKTQIPNNSQDQKSVPSSSSPKKQTACSQAHQASSQ